MMVCSLVLYLAPAACTIHIQHYQSLIYITENNKIHTATQILHYSFNLDYNSVTLAAAAMPTAFPIPAPRGPVVASIPGVLCYRYK